MINEDNIELILFRYKEGLLDEAETAEVEKALASRPDWQELADSYDPGLVLPAGATMSYPHAASLRNGGPKAVRRKMIPVWITSAAAACLLFAVVVGFLNRTPVVPQSTPMVVAAQPAVTVDTMHWSTETSAPTSITPSPKAKTYSNTAAVDNNNAPTVEENAERIMPSGREEVILSTPAVAEEPMMVADISGLKPSSCDVDVDNEEAVYSTRLITYIDDFSEQASLRTPPVYSTGQTQGDARSAISDQVSDLASKSGSFIANTRRRYQEHESQIASDIEDIAENNPIIRRLLASIL